jgi:amidohydrolase
MIPAKRFGLCLTIAVVASASAVATLSAAVDLREAVRERVATEYPSLLGIYEHLHANPELSFMEVKTAALLAGQLRSLGFEVTEKVGNTGVVAVLKNGPGPTVLVRAELDALPGKETSGVPYASTAVVKDLSGKDQPAMHACAHDTHVASLIGTARVLVAMKDHWSGTLVMIGQPAEEILAGARAMLSDGLFTRFPKPDYALALHTLADDPAGTVRYSNGAALSGLCSLDILVRGVSGHGSAPHTTKDPVVIAAQIVLSLQTIVSREVKPGTVAVITVGTIHGGLKRNVIPDEVKLELSIRAFDDAVMQQEIAAIRRICEGTARAAGVPDNRLPVVTVTSESVDPTINDPALTRRLAAAFNAWLGEDNVKEVPPLTAADDFTMYGRTQERVPLFNWRVGGTAPERFAESERTGVRVPSNHNSGFVPVPEPTIKTAIVSMTAAVLELMGQAVDGRRLPLLRAPDLSGATARTST